MSGRGQAVTIVNACRRDGAGGSPTAVLDDRPMTDAERRAVPVQMGTSHAVFLSPGDGGRSGEAVSLRFFTAEGELPACGHGTVAALTVLAERAGSDDLRVRLRAPERVFTGRSVRDGNRFKSTFDPGRVELRDATGEERDLMLTALGLDAGTPADCARVASVGRPRLLVPVADRAALAALAPDLAGLRAACDGLGLLGAYVHAMDAGRGAARMFAPSIGVPEDIANANSTACLAAHLAGQGITDISVDMGDSLGAPSTITAGSRQGAAGPTVHVGGTATIERTTVLHLQ